MNLIYFYNIASTACLLFVCVACVLHITANIDKHSGEFERWGFVLTGAGAFGQVVYIWWPKIESFPFELVMHGGMALIAFSLVQGRLRALMMRMPGMHWTDRRTQSERHAGLGD